MENEKLINAEKLKLAIRDDPEIDGQNFARMKMHIEEALAVEVVHGHWVKYNFLGHKQVACSECQTLGSPQWKRCPVCEAKMDGERRTEDGK